MAATRLTSAAARLQNDRSRLNMAATRLTSAAARLQND